MDTTKSWLWDIFTLSCHWVDQCGSTGLSWLFLFVLETGQRGVYWGIRWDEYDVAYLPAPGKSGREELCAVWRAWKTSNSNLAIIYFQRKLLGWGCSSVIEYGHKALDLILSAARKQKLPRRRGNDLVSLRVRSCTGHCLPQREASVVCAARCIDVSMAITNHWTLVHYSVSLAE